MTRTWSAVLARLGVPTGDGRIIAPGGQELHAVGCNVFTPVKGGFSQTQLGNTLTRIDKAPLLSGRYTLRITVDGQTVEVTFTIR